MLIAKKLFLEKFEIQYFAHRFFCDYKVFFLFFLKGIGIRLR
jgi:hypothetical protein